MVNISKEEGVLIYSQYKKVDIMVCVKIVSLTFTTLLTLLKLLGQSSENAGHPHFSPVSTIKVAYIFGHHVFFVTDRIDSLYPIVQLCYNHILTKGRNFRSTNIFIL
jgi:hypothetical protein